MTERSKQLSEQAKNYVDDKWAKEGSQVYPMNERDEKFAELIVKECFKAAMIEAKGHMHPKDLMDRMNKMVGIKE